MCIYKICVYIYICNTYIYMCVCVCVCVYVYIHIHTYTSKHNYRRKASTCQRAPEPQYCGPPASVQVRLGPKNASHNVGKAKCRGPGRHTVPNCYFGLLAS